MSDEPYTLTPGEEATINAQEYDGPEDEYKLECPKHGLQDVVEEGGYTGFAGGACYWSKLACGCHLVDESDDVRAAQ